VSQAGLVDIESSHPQIPTAFVTDSGTAVPIANVIEILGTTVAAHNIPLETTGSGNTVTVTAQYASAQASSSGTHAGFASFNSAYFTVDASGFVSLSGSAVGETITGNSGGAISPVAGNWNIVTANATVKFVGTSGTETLDFGLDVLLLGSDESLSSTSQSCVGIGFGTLSSITSASATVAVGHPCMSNTTSGVQNTAVGSLALNSNVIGSNSVAIGYNALAASTGGGNTAVGSGALTSLVTSGQCVALGYQALATATTIGNTAVGFQALTAVSGGSGSNTALGGSSGANLASGSFNILIGQNCATNYANAESSNIVLGNAGLANESNVIRIGTAGSGSQQQNKCFVAGITGVTATGSPCAISSTGQLSDLGFGTSGQVLTSTGAASSPTWQAADASYISGVYGNGSDGAQTFDGMTTILGLVPSNSTYTLTRDIFLASSTINMGVSIITDGYRIFCNGTLTNNGTIQWNGNNAVLNTAGAALSNASSSFLGSNTGSAGGAGGASNGTAGSNQSNSPLALGATGGAGGNGTGGSSGKAAGTVSTRTTQLGSIQYLPAMTQGFYFSASGLMTVLGGTGGGGGGGDTVNDGGGGGSGGGVVLLSVHLFAGTGNIQALGGNGGNGASLGTNCGSGGGGGGGGILITSSSISAGAIAGQTLSVAGGTAGTPTGLGAMGSNGSTGNIYLLAN
jgi:hypothetical protein